MSEEVDQEADDNEDILGQEDIIIEDEEASIVEEDVPIEQGGIPFENESEIIDISEDASEQEFTMDYNIEDIEEDAL